MTEDRFTEADVHRYAYFVAGHPDARVGRQHLNAARAILDGLAQDDRLLPSGGEVREEWVARWTPNAEMAVQGYEVELSPPGSRQRAEQYARRLRGPDDGVVEMLRQRTYIGPWEVVSDTSEAPDG